MTVLPHDEDLTVSVSVDHALVDEEPDNNSFSTTVPVVPNPTIPGQPDDPTASELTPTPVPTADPPLEPQPTASAQPTQPAEPTPTSPPTVVPTTTPTPSATPADPDQPGGDGTSGTGPTPSPTPTTEADTTDTGATGGGGVGQATEVVVTQQQPAVEPDDPLVVPAEPTP